MEPFISDFSFDPRILGLDEGNDFIARVGSRVQTREKLFDVLRRELRLPNYFGDNWDALSDCLRDLSWIKQRRVVIEHTELPQLDEKDMAVYLDVLAECVQDWKQLDEHQLIVVFPEAARPTLTAIASAAN